MMDHFRGAFLILKMISWQMQEVLFGRIEGGGKEEWKGRERRRRERREGKGKLGRGYNYVFTHLIYKKDLSHSPNGFYGLFLIS